MIPNDIPVLTKKQMIKVDQLMIECYGISLIQMMENAGRNLAVLAKRFLGIISDKTNICIVAGNGNNGGGGLVAARHLSNWGANVTVLVLSPQSNFKKVPGKQLDIISHLPISIVYAGNQSHYINWHNCDLIIDAIIGYGLNRKPEGNTAQIIEKINFMNRPVISFDTPSGLDTNLGYISEPVIKADATLTLALPKTGLIQNMSLDCVGDLYLADISVPPLLYSQLGLKVPAMFDRDTIVLYKTQKKWPLKSILI